MSVCVCVYVITVNVLHSLLNRSVLFYQRRAGMHTRAPSSSSSSTQRAARIPPPSWLRHEVRRAETDWPTLLPKKGLPTCVRVCASTLLCFYLILFLLSPSPTKLYASITLPWRWPVHPSSSWLLRPLFLFFLNYIFFSLICTLHFTEKFTPFWGEKTKISTGAHNEKRVFLKLDSLSLSATCYTTRMRGGACCSHQKKNLLSEAGSNHLIYIRLLAAAAGALWMGQRSGNRCSRRRWRGQPVLGLDLAQLVSPNPPHLTRLNLSSEIPTQNVLTLRPSSKVGGANNTWLYLVDFLIFVRNTKRGPPSKRAGRRIDEVKTGI